MNPDAERLRKIDRVFDQSLDLSGEERQAFLDEACSGDEDLRERVDRLLAAAEKPRIQPGGALIGNFGDELLLHLEDSHLHSAGTQVGPYRLLREVGTSGVAVVFLARHEDDEFAEEVVLKLYRAEPESVVSDWLATRPEPEPFDDTVTLVEGASWSGQLVDSVEDGVVSEEGDAALDSGTLDFGALDGEEVKVPHSGLARVLDGGFHSDGRIYVVMEHVDGARLDEHCDQRSLEIEQRLELFLQICDALQAAHSHLVVHGDLKLSSLMVSAAGRLRVLDVGLAELLGSRSSQVLGRSQRPTAGVWVDIRRLGEVLLSLLTGRRVHDEDPATRRLASEQVGNDDEVVHVALARTRGLVPSALRRRLEGDLDAIIERAMASGPGVGYSSVEDLASDVRRHLGGESLDATAPEGRSPRRAQTANWGTLIAGAVLLLAAGTALGMFGSRWLSATRSTETVEPDALETFVGRLFRDVDVRDSQGTEVAARELLDRAVQQIERESLSSQQRSDQYAALAASYRHLGVLDRALTVQSAALVAIEDLPEEAVRTVQRLKERAALELDAGLPAARSTAAEAVELAAGLGDERLLASARAVLGQALVEDEPERAVAELEASVPNLRADELFAARLAWAEGLRDRGEADRAEAVLQEAVTHARSRPGSELGLVLAALGAHHLSLGRPSEASASYVDAQVELTAALGEGHWRVAEVLNSLSESRVAEGRLEDALEASRQALNVSRRVFGDRHPRTQIARSNFALRLFDYGELERVEGLLASAVQVLQSELAPELQFAAVEAWQRLSLVRVAMGRFDGAVAASESAVSLQRSLNPESEQQVVNRILLARASLAAGQSDPALVASLETAFGDDRTPALWRNLGRTAWAAARLRQKRLSAEDLDPVQGQLELAVAAFDVSPGRSSWQAAEARGELAALKLQLGDPDGARELLAQCAGVVAGRGDRLEARIDALRRTAGDS